MPAPGAPAGVPLFVYLIISTSHEPKHYSMDSYIIAPYESMTIHTNGWSLTQYNAWLRFLIFQHIRIVTIHFYSFVIAVWSPNIREIFFIMDENCDIGGRNAMA